MGMEMALVWTSHHLDAAMAGRLFLERPYWRPPVSEFLGRGTRRSFLVRHGFTRIGLFLTTGFGLAGIRKARAFPPRCTAILGPLHAGRRTGFLVLLAMRLRLGVGVGRGLLGVASRKCGRCCGQGEGNKESFHDFPWWVDVRTEERPLLEGAAKHLFAYLAGESPRIP